MGAGAPTGFAQPMFGRYHVEIVHDWADDSKSVYILQKGRDDWHYLGLGPWLKTRAYPSSGEMTPAFVDTRAMRDDGMSFLQSMMDAMWREGIRPTAPLVSEQEMSAMRYHLEDMRALVFAARSPVRADGTKA